MNATLKALAGLLSFLAIILATINSYFLYSIVNAPTFMWVIFATYLLLMFMGIVLSVLADRMN